MSVFTAFCAWRRENLPGLLDGESLSQILGAWKDSNILFPSLK